jgi:hypothetical protein
MSVDALPSKSTESTELMDTTTTPQSQVPSSPSTRSKQATTSSTSPSKQTVTSSLFQATHPRVEAIHRVCISHPQESGVEPSFESVLANSENTYQPPSLPRAETSRAAQIPNKEKSILRVEACLNVEDNRFDSI